MKQNITLINPEYISPNELMHRLETMAILDVIMNPSEEACFRLVQKYLSGEAYNIDNGSGDELDIFFEENGVFILGFDHENDLNQFGADEWDEDFFTATYEGVPKSFLDIYDDEESLHNMTFCMWYSYDEGCWKQNATDGNDGGKDYLLSYICKDAAAWIEWGAEYYEQEFDIKVVEKVYEGKKLTEEDVLLLNPDRDVMEALEEISRLSKVL